MAADLSIRQLLACLNISVFDPTMDPALKKVDGIKTEEEKENKDPLHTVFLLTGMSAAALLCFYGLRSHPFAAGFPLFAICGLALRKTVSHVSRFFLKTYFLSGLFLLAEALFSLSPAAFTAVFFVFLFRNLFFPAHHWQKTILSILFFSGVCFLCRDNLIFCLGAFSILGMTALLFPLKNIYAHETGMVFLIFPLLILLSDGIFSMSGIFPPPEVGKIMSVPFTLQLLLLIFALRREMEINELFSFFSGTVLLFLVGLIWSAGIQGSLVLFLIAFFTNSLFLGNVAAVLFACFFILLLLSLPVSLFTAGVISLTSGVIFAVLRYRIKKVRAKEK